MQTSGGATITVLDCYLRLNDKFEVLSHRGTSNPFGMVVMKNGIPTMRLSQCCASEDLAWAPTT